MAGVDELREQDRAVLAHGQATARGSGLQGRAPRHVGQRDQATPPPTCGSTASHPRRTGNQARRASRTIVLKVKHETLSRARRVGANHEPVRGGHGFRKSRGATRLPHLIDCRWIDVTGTAFGPAFLCTLPPGSEGGTPSVRRTSPFDAGPTAGGCCGTGSSRGCWRCRSGSRRGIGWPPRCWRSGRLWSLR